MASDPRPGSGNGHVVVSLWRYPVKSMMGEELNASEVGLAGLAGDRGFALRDLETGKIVGAKNPRKWADFFAFRAALADGMPGSVRITLPDGSLLSSDDADLGARLSEVLGRDVSFEASSPADATAEAYWPDMEGLDFRDTVTNFTMPAGTFFDAASVLLLTTATLDHLRALYPQGRFEARRFRPNVVIATAPGEDGFVENDWVGRTLAIGDDVRLRVTKLCSRCVMTTLPQGDLPKDAGILRTAVQHNGGRVGAYAEVAVGGVIRRGDPVTVI